jgi:hypothetical protein
LTERAVSHVRFELAQIEQLLDIYPDLFTRVQQRPPDLVEITAVASVLHSFYNGLENIFLAIAKGCDHQVPTGAQWHRDLLVQMMQRTEHRSRVLSAALAQKLRNYLGFRHVYRHSYAFFLEWTELQELVTALPALWMQLKAELALFLATLSPAESGGQNST